MRPIDADLLNEKLEKLMDFYDCDGYTPAYVAVKNAMDAVAFCPTVDKPQWISVEDKLPETIWKDVLAYRKSGKIQVVRYFGGHDGCGYFSDGQCYGEAKDLGITHWMTLPMPPVEKENNNDK